MPGKFTSLLPGFEMKFKAPRIFGGGRKKNKRSSDFEWDDRF